MKILEYNSLDLENLDRAYQKVLVMLKNSDYQSAELKKLQGTPYYRVKLDHTNRLLIQPIKYQGCNYWLVLELIKNHAYDKSKFLNGAKVIERNINIPEEINKEAEELIYINNKRNKINVLDKLISFDDEQMQIYDYLLPVIIIGSAGSGKTMLTLEKLKQQIGNILYVTHSNFLVKNSRTLYYANNYSNEDQQIDFLSYQEFLETIHIPQTKEITFSIFANWIKQQYVQKYISSPNKLFEEFKGVITGSQIDKAYLTKEDYLALGVKQSIYLVEQREQIYALFIKYLTFLQDNNQHDLNILSFNYLPKITPVYDVIVIDELQDFTMVQLHLILSALKEKHNFLLCGDSNQIVHPNFFSWAKTKSYFYKYATIDREIAFILKQNYRNSLQVTELGNRILRVKNARFGSIDKESNYLVTGTASNQGVVQLFVLEPNLLKTINNKIKLSTHVAVIVLTEREKIQVREVLQTPLVFTVQEAKGLEYENIIIYNMLSEEGEAFREIARDVDITSNTEELAYLRAKDKTDKSLEIYKFYINSLYVAVTRAINNVYLLEVDTTHKLLTVLGLQENSASTFSLECSNSSLQEWQQEASKLEAQGKKEQADFIRDNIIKQKTISWQVLDKAKIAELKATASGTEQKLAKEAKIALLEYAIVYVEQRILRFLRQLDFKAAFTPQKNEQLVYRKYFTGYDSSNIKPALNQVEQFGVDFRNVFNLTPLMSATLFGNEFLIRELNKLGANKELLDNSNRNVLQIALNKAICIQQYAKTKLPRIYHLLMANSMSIQVDERLIKLDSKIMEFFLLNLIIATYHTDDLKPTEHIIITAGIITSMVINFPEQVLLDRRKKQSYISSILAKNELDSNNPYNRKLFTRINRGKYILNPELAIKVQDEWKNIYSLLKGSISVMGSATVYKQRGPV